jgi:hypothetical protein
MVKAYLSGSARQSRVTVLLSFYVATKRKEPSVSELGGSINTGVRTSYQRKKLKQD